VLGWDPFMKACKYCGRENEDKAPRCRECGTEFAPEEAPRQSIEPVAAPPRLPMTRSEIAAGIVCWVTSAVGAFYGLFAIMIMAWSMIGAGHKPSMPFTVFVLPVITILVGGYMLRDGSARGRVRGLRWLLVPPLCLSAVTVFLVPLTWFTS
jgi:hypothetical protein